MQPANVTKHVQAQIDYVSSAHKSQGINKMLEKPELSLECSFQNLYAEYRMKPLC